MITTTEQPFTEISEQAEREIENGSFAPPAAAAPHKSSIVVTTFNIRYAVGSFLIMGSILRGLGLARPRRRSLLIERHLLQAAGALSDNLRMPAADIIALQEADRGTIRAGGHHIARELARALRMNYVHAAMGIPRGEAPQPKQWYLDFEEHIALDDHGDTGVAILSRLPLENAARVELPWFGCAWRPRLALTTTVRVGTKRLHVFNSHIDPHASIEERLRQHEAVLAHANRASSGEPVILLGDFNTLTPDSRIRMRHLLESHGYITPLPTGVATWRAGLIRLHTDWIFVRGARVARWGVTRPLSVSDHWPVWVEIAVEH